MKKAAVFFLLLMAAAPLRAQTPPPPSTAGETFSDPAMEARARAMQRQLRCLVCQGESIDESHSPLAADLRRPCEISRPAKT